MAIQTEKPQGQEQPLYTPPGPQPIVFEDFSGGLNTNSTRPGIPDKDLWWSDGFMPIAANYLRTIPDVGTFIFDASNPAGGGGGGGGGGGVQKLWEVGLSCEYQQWGLTDNGNVEPTISVQGPTTLLEGPAGNDFSLSPAMDFDSSGNVYVLAQKAVTSVGPEGNYSVVKFSKGTTGNSAPLTEIVGAATNLPTGQSALRYGGLCIDASDNLYVGIGYGAGAVAPLSAGGNIWKFPAGSAGNAASTNFFNDPNISAIRSLTYDSLRGWIWMSAVQTVAGTDTPILKAFDSSGFVKRNLTNAAITIQLYQVAISKTGKIGLVITDIGANGTVLIFPASADGTDAPIQTISGHTNAGIASPSGIAFDSSENIYVADQGYWFAVPPSVGALLSFASDATGDVAPLTVITGTSTGLDLMSDGSPTAPSQLRVHT